LADPVSEHIQHGLHHRVQLEPPVAWDEPAGLDHRQVQQAIDDVEKSRAAFGDSRHIVLLFG